MPDSSDLNRRNESESGLLEGKTVSRRQFLKLAGIAGATIGVGAGLGGVVAACGGGTTTTTAATPGTTAATTATTTGAVTTVSAGASTTASSAAANLAIPLNSGETLFAGAESNANDYYKEWRRGAQQACDALGLKLDFNAANYDPTAQLSQFETAGTQGRKLAIGVVIGPGPVPQVAATAQKYKFHFCNTWNNPEWVLPETMGTFPNDYFVSYFVPQTVNIHLLKTKQLFEAMGGKGGLVHISGLPGGSADWTRTLAVDLALKEYPNIKLLFRQAGSWVRDKSQTAMEAAIARFGKEITGVVGQNDDVAAGCLAALEGAGMTGIPICGSDGTAEAMENIIAGKMLSTVMDIGSWQAGYMVVRAWDAANGWKRDPVEQLMLSEGIITTKDNVKEIQAKYLTNTTPSFDYKLMSRVLHPDDWDPQNGLTVLRPDVWWGPGPTAKPADFDSAMPADSKAAVAAGKFDEIDKLYADHYKIKTIEGLPTGTVAA
jgi:ribose transport system substrate-binding protein